MLIHPPTKSILLKVPDPLAVREVLHLSRTLDHPDYNVAVKYTQESAKVLRNLGFDVPHPVQTIYNWPGKYKPFAHQRVTTEFLVTHRKCFNLSEMGVGKTASSLWAADYLMQTGQIKKCLILSPLSTLERVWKNDIFDVLMHRSAIVVYGSREKRLEALKADCQFFIMNHDGLTISDVHAAITRDPDIGLVIVDEASMFRNHQTKKYKALSKMIRPDMRLWLLTGTPCPNAPTDAWALARLVDHTKVPKFFGAFRQQTMMEISRFKFVARNDAYNTAYAAMQPAVRFKKADCLDLPPVITLDRASQLTPDQLKAVKEMKNQMHAEIADGLPVTAVNAADKINKLRQILCGSIKDPVSGTYLHVDHGPRTDVLRECIEAASAKVLVVVPFKGAINSLAEEIGTTHSVAILNGDISPKMRDKIVWDFKNTPDPHVLLCHPKVMSHGLNLTEADTLIFYAPIYSNDEFQQVTERFNRAGQTRKMTIVRIGAHPIEWEIYRMVDNKKTSQDNILSLYRSLSE